MNFRHILLPLLTMVVTFLFTKGEYLFRASPGGDGNKPAGLWGGFIDIERNGQGTNLFSHGYESLNTSYTTYYGIEIEYVSFDPISQRVLMIIDEPDASASSMKHSMAIGPLCQDGCASLEATFENFKFTDENHPYLMDRDCGWKCGWGPFAFYNNQIYFVFSGVFGTSYASLKRQIQIRMLFGCGDIIDSIKNYGGQQEFNEEADFPILQCSILIIKVHEEQYTKPNPKSKIWVTKDLKIITSLDQDADVHFFLQLVDASISTSIKMNLLHIHNSQIHQLYSEQIGVIYTGNTQFTGIGSVDYKDGYLCWSTAERLHCSAYDINGYSVNPTVVMDGVTAVESGVCNTENLPQQELQRTLTGVVISDTEKTLSLYFGCYADIPGTGGIGLITITNHGLTKWSYEVKSGPHKVFGGSLFITDTVDIGCNNENINGLCNVQTSSTTTFNKDGSSNSATIDDDAVSGAVMPSCTGCDRASITIMIVSTLLPVLLTV